MNRKTRKINVLRVFVFKGVTPASTAACLPPACR
jgi:hypothetical protein